MLVNESSIDEFQIEEGLKQSDPPAPFSFLVAVEGFANLMTNVTTMGFTNHLESMKMSYILCYNLQMV